MAKVRVASVGEVPVGEMRRVEVGEQPVVLLNLDGEIHALGDICSHEYASLSEGYFEPEDCVVECPKHGALFDVRTGAAKTLPATKPVPRFEVTVDGDDIYVEETPA